MTDQNSSNHKLSKAVFPEVAEAIGSINGEDRIKTLMYAFRKALEAGKAKGDQQFDTEAAIAALESGRLQLRGSQEQIAGQLVLIRGATSMLRRALDYAVSDTAQPLMLSNEEEERPRPQPIRNANGPKPRI